MIRYTDRREMLFDVVERILGFQIVRYDDSDREYADRPDTFKGFMSAGERVVYLNTDRDTETQCKTLLSALYVIIFALDYNLPLEEDGLVNGAYWLLSQMDRPARIDSVKDL